MTARQAWRDLMELHRDWLDVEAADDFHRDTRFRCGRGWLPILEALLDELEPIVRETEVKGLLFLMRSGDGGLHVLDGWLPDRSAMRAAWAACERAMTRSRVTCETCGASGRPRPREEEDAVIACDWHAADQWEDNDDGRI